MRESSGPMGYTGSRTGIDVEVRQVQHLETFPARFLWRRERVGLRLCEPASEIKRWRRREGTRIRDKVLAYHLREI